MKGDISELLWTIILILVFGLPSAIQILRSNRRS